MRMPRNIRHCCDHIRRISSRIRDIALRRYLTLLCGHSRRWSQAYSAHIRRYIGHRFDDIRHISSGICYTLYTPCKIIDVPLQQYSMDIPSDIRHRLPTICEGHHQGHSTSLCKDIRQIYSTKLWRDMRHRPAGIFDRLSGGYSTSPSKNIRHCPAKIFDRYPGQSPGSSRIESESKFKLDKLRGA
jgi:hypothetical protein